MKKHVGLHSAPEWQGYADAGHFPGDRRAYHGPSASPADDDRQEATGGYQTALVDGLREADIACAVVNPRQLNALSIAQSRTQSLNLILDAPKTPEQLNMAFLFRRCDQLQAMLISNTH